MNNPTNITPIHDRIIIKPDEAADISAGGIHIADIAKERPGKGIVVAAGPGLNDEKTTVKPGMTVLFGKYSGTEITHEGQLYIMLREGDIYSFLDGDKIIPLHDRIIVKPDAVDTVTAGGIIIPDIAVEMPIKGIIVAVGPGTKEMPVSVKPGDNIMFKKYSGGEITHENEKYILLRESDIYFVVG